MPGTLPDMEHFADHNRRLESLVRLGTIAQVQVTPPRVRVQSGELVTTWLPWLTIRAGATRTWSPPTNGEQCVLLCLSGDPSTGLVLLGLFSDDHPAPSTDLNEHVIAWPDGAVMRYHHGTGALAVTGIKTARVEAADSVTVDCPYSEFTGDVHILGKLEVDGEALITSLLTYMSGLSGSGGAAGKTVIRGQISHEGDFENKGTLSSNGIVLDSHKHTGIKAGGDLSGGPQ